MNSQPLPAERSSRPRLAWHHYLLAALFAYALPRLAIIVEMFLTWHVQIHLVGHFGLPPLFTDPLAWYWMTLPGAITFLILLPFIRSSKRRWIASACVFLAWTLFFLSSQANTK